MGNKIRLQKYLSSCGVASRRKSEELIKSGAIKVNDITVLEMGYKVDEDDVVTVNGKAAAPADKKYYVLNKPEGYICSKSDKWGKKSVFDLIEKDNSLFYAGRLDYMSEGLIIITNDGDFAQSIVHPSAGIIKTYIIESSVLIPLKLLNLFKRGIYVNQIFYKAIDASYLNGEKNRVVVKLNEGKKREIREVFKKFKIPVLKLVRTGIGMLFLEALSLETGEIKKYNLQDLKEAIYGKKV